MSSESNVVLPITQKTLIGAQDGNLDELRKFLEQVEGDESIEIQAEDNNHTIAGSGAELMVHKRVNPKKLK